MLKSHSEEDIDQTVYVVEERKQGRKGNTERKEGGDRTWGERGQQNLQREEKMRTGDIRQGRFLGGYQGDSS